MNKEQIIQIIQEKFNSAIEVEINEEVLNKCKNFAEAVTPTTKYGDCGQNNMDKRFIDNMIGKIGEYSTYAILSNICEIKLDQPDIKIYKGRQKSWKSDLVINTDDGEINIAVKSQSMSQAMKYSFSGTFQVASFRKDKVFENTNELIFLCMIDDIHECKKTLVMPPKTLSEIKFADPKLPKFKGIKTCYYVKDNFSQENLETWMKDFGVTKLDTII